MIREYGWHPSYTVSSVDHVMTPALVVYPEIIASNIERTLALLGGDADRWRVHIKRGSAMRHFIVANLLLLFEAEYLSPKKLLSWRFLTGYLRRLPEVLDYVQMAFRTATQGKDSLVKAVTSIAEG